MAGAFSRTGPVRGRGPGAAAAPARRLGPPPIQRAATPIAAAGQSGASPRAAPTSRAALHRTFVPTTSSRYLLTAERSSTVVKIHRPGQPFPDRHLDRRGDSL